jgi:histidine phosphotransferase ChpT
MEHQDLAHKLGEAVIVRLCHDLASPAGALANGADIIGMAGDDADFMREAVGLLKTSSKALTARLEFYRATFGAPNAQALVAVGARSVADGFLSVLGDRARVYTLTEFPPFPTSGQDNAPEWWRLALLLVLVAADAAPFGANISVSEENGWPLLQVSGRQAVLPESFFMVEDLTVSINPRALAGVALRYRASMANLTVKAENMEDGFCIGFAKKDL